MRFRSSSCDAGLFEGESVGEGPAADGDEHLVGGELEFLAVAFGGEHAVGEAGDLGATSIFRPCFCRRRVKLRTMSSS
jgi:hypothetical protein